MRNRWVLGAAGALVCLSLAAPAAPAAPKKIKLQPFELSASQRAKLQRSWIAQIERRYAPGTWAPMKMTLSDRDLSVLGLPPARVLRKLDFSTPKMVNRRGRTRAAPLPTVATFAGAGWFGIRPGAFLLLISGNSIGWCSAADVYGSAGAYSISTAGHCGKSGATASVIAAYGNRAGALEPIVLDFGKFSSSVDGGVGNDYAKISIDAAYQALATPTAAFWGGPRGVFTKTGTPAGVTFPKNGLVPSVTVTPDPLLAQQLVHYGHGAGVGAGGTARSATALHWGASHYMFFGAISPGDSGSYSHTLAGDTAGANMESAGINTHLYVDPLMRQGLGIMAGTRTTKVGTPANGQIVPYPAPFPIGP